MAIRLLPYRQYDEADVFNAYYMYTTQGIENPDTQGNNAAGVVVHVGAGNLNDDPVNLTEGAGEDPRKQHASPIGRNGIPVAQGYVVATAANNVRPIGITLNQTLKFDENGEPLLYNPTKLTELQAVLPYQAVPVVSKGIFTLTEDAFITGHTYAPGTKLGFGIQGNQAGLLVNYDEQPSFALGDAYSVGTIIGTGSRAAGDGYAGNYYMVKLDF
tara:strand:- start:2124 stop:2768 length:645 start_codon:yes stop_codon:yes gene_type:complete